MDTRNLAVRRVAQSRGPGASSTCMLAFCCVVLPLTVVYALQRQPAEAPLAIVEDVKALEPIDGPGPQLTLKTPVVGGVTTLASAGAVEAAVQRPAATASASSPAKSAAPVAEHESSQPMAVLNRERARAGGYAFKHAFKVYRPAEGAIRPGGNLDDVSTLPRAVEASAADGEVMMLCIGGSGSMRAGMNLVLNFRTMGLYNMLILAPEQGVCEDLWKALPSLACVWWPKVFTGARPNSLYNTMFSRTALAFFEARKVLLERLVLHHKLNVLHLDADTVWFANPYPLFKTLYKDYSLIVQTDNPFVNAGILYVQNVHDGDAAAWVLAELNRRISRFTYHPETVRQLPNSAWSTAPHFANADEQANLNDIVTTALNGEDTFSAGVEFYEARFKRDRGDSHARSLMANGGWTNRMATGDVNRARRRLGHLRPETRYEPLVHLCKPNLWVGVSDAVISVPHNASAKPSKLLLAPEWLFSHFPYGAFFPSFRDCHADSWGYKARTALEQRLCMPDFRVPVVMVHMAGLRNGQWGRRGVMRALGVWHESADSVATADWVSPRTPKLLAVDGDVVSKFQSMAEFDRFAARLLLLGLLLKRRAVIPSMPCPTRWAQNAMEPRHLRGLEVGCGKHKQCVWLPMPHFKEPWCSGVDFVYSIDYEGMVDAGKISPATDVARVPIAELSVAGTPTATSVIERRAGAAATRPEEIDARVLLLSSWSGTGEPLDWLPLDGFREKRWRAPFARRVGDVLRSGSGLGLNEPQMQIVSDCMQSLATSRD